MPGSASLTLGAKRLPEAELPLARGDVGYGEPVRCTVKNTGTTRLTKIELESKGDGAKNICFGDTRRATKIGKIQLEGDLKPGQEVDFWIRSRFAFGDVEDARAFDIVVNARSVG